MRHIKTVSRVTKPSSASVPTLFDCFDYLINTGDFKGFVDCLDFKFTCTS